MHAASQYFCYVACKKSGVKADYILPGYCLQSCVSMIGAYVMNSFCVCIKGALQHIFFRNTVMSALPFNESIPTSFLGGGGALLHCG